LDFSWTEEQAAFRKEVIRFAKQELNDDLERRDRDEEFPREFWSKCAEFGIQGLPAPVEYGGGGADTLTTVCALEALGYGCKDNGFLFSLNAHLWTSVIPVMTFGTDEQKRRYLPKLISGEWIGLHCMTEPMSGSDAYSLKTRAERKGDCYVLNGSKTFITNTLHGDLFAVFANVDPEKGAAGVTAFLIEKGTPGLTIGNKLHKMGLRTSPMSEVALEDCLVPASSILGKEGSGQAIFNHSMEWERICIMASHLGMQQRLIETCVKYGRERQQFGAPIGKFSAIANKVADMEVRLETGRLLLYKAAWLKSQGKHALREASMAKLHVSETTVQTCLDAIQIHGGYGYMKEYEMERDLRDAISGKIYSGTSEIQKVIIAGFQGL
jgi:alkylation response protein AidB-like acyl-CoA dehydrogenase